MDKFSQSTLFEIILIIGAIYPPAKTFSFTPSHIE
jgi:hypothetical protein